MTVAMTLAMTVAVTNAATMLTIREETPFDVAQREALLDSAFGAARFAKTAERLREQRLPADGLSFTACVDGRLVGTVRLWSIAAGRGRPALLLGPLAVDAEFRECGIGGALMRHALAAAEARGHGAVFLVGDAPYYSRFGFTAEATGALTLPGPYARERFLARELVPGALAGAHGMVGATGVRVRKAAVRFRALTGNDRTLAHKTLAPRAA